MKLTIFCRVQLRTLFVAAILSIAFLSFKVDNQNKFKIPPSYSTLDSLQGDWLNEDDSTNKVSINGRNWINTFYSNGALISQSLRIYFSDTAVLGNTFSDIKIDTTAISGRFVVTLDISDNSVDCIYLNGFYIDTTQTTFSFNPVTNISAGATQVFRKQ